MPITTFFYAPPANFTEDTVRLPEDEAHHALRVLRLRVGAEIEVVDGVGGWYRVELIRSDPKGVEGVVHDRRLGVGESMFDLRLGLGVIKSRSRLETAVEKAVELGVNEITLLECRNSEGSRLDIDRCIRVAKAAMKQSLRSVLPRVTGPVSFGSLFSESAAPRGFICEASEDAVHLVDVVDDVVAGEECLVLIGPEGGFRREEVEAAEKAGLHAVSLGRRRLRTETAVVVACGAIALAADRDKRKEWET